MMIDIKVFLASFLIGVLVTLVAGPKKKIIYVQPTPDNVTDYLFKDKSGVCFSVAATKGICNKSSKDYNAQV